LWCRMGLDGEDEKGEHWGVGEEEQGWGGDKARRSAYVIILPPKLPPPSPSHTHTQHTKRRIPEKGMKRVVK
jgi:hypothetical protein